MKRYMPALTYFIFSIMIASCSENISAFAKPSNESKPNILIIIADDMGFADLGSFGSEIETPHLDALAYDGVRLANFYASPVCSVTRAMLLTGVDSHKAGLGNMAEELAPNQENQPGYEGEINERVLTLAEILKPEGYATYYSGKWHLGMSKQASPANRGFDNSFALLSGGASHFGDMRPAYHPDPDGKAPYQQDGKRLNSLPEGFDFSSQYYADYLIEKIGQTADEQPFFAVLGYTAPHWPLQAPQAIIDKYVGRYDGGYDALAQARLTKQIELGLLPPLVSLTNPSPKHIAWDDLSTDDQSTQSRAMEIYAAMIDDMDTQTGRVIGALKQSGKFENTIIIFLSDNGAEGHDLDETWPEDLFPKIRKNIDERHDFSFENMGKPDSYVLYGPGWARAGSPAFRLHKGFPTEGGVRTAAFVHYNGYDQGIISNEFITVKDIVPTLLDQLKLPYPASTREQPSGQSALNALNNTSQVEATERVYVGEVLGKYFVRRGQWKMVRMPAPHGNNNWQLYDLSTDIGEQIDQSKARADIVAALTVDWNLYAEQNSVILPNWTSGY